MHADALEYCAARAQPSRGSFHFYNYIFSRPQRCTALGPSAAGLCLRNSMPHKVPSTVGTRTRTFTLTGCEWRRPDARARFRAVNLYPRQSQAYGVSGELRDRGVGVVIEKRLDICARARERRRRCRRGCCHDVLMHIAFRPETRGGSFYSSYHWPFPSAAPGALASLSARWHLKVIFSGRCHYVSSGHSDRCNTVLPPLALYSTRRGCHYMRDCYMSDMPFKSDTLPTPANTINTYMSSSSSSTLFR